MKKAIIITIILIFGIAVVYFSIKSRTPEKKEGETKKEEQVTTPDEPEDESQEEEPTTKEIQIELASESPFIFGTVSCTTEYTLKISAPEAMTVTYDGNPMPQEFDGLFASTFTIDGGLHEYEIVATDTESNQSTKQVTIDALCRVDSPYGQVHPWCYQRAIIDCAPDQASSCITNYMNTQCGEYH